MSPRKATTGRSLAAASPRAVSYTHLDVYKRQGERGLQASDRQGDTLWKMDAQLGRPQGIINLCSWCKRVPDESGEWYDLATFIAERSAIQFNGGLCPECMDQCFPCDERHK